MTAFFLAVLVAYALVQLLIYWKLRQACAGRRACHFAAIAFLLLLNGVLILSRVLRAWGLPGAEVAAMLGRSWLAVSMWLALIGALAGLWNTAVRLASRLGRDVRWLLIRPRPLVAGAAVVMACLCVWGVFEAGDIRLETLVVRTRRLPAGSKPVRVVQLSDLHLGAQMGQGRLAAILDRVREARPDLLVFTGDFVDGAGPHVDRLVRQVAELDAPLGKFAVTGNHEFYLGLPLAEQFLRDGGFRLLRGESVKVAEHLVVAGVDDIAGQWLGAAASTDEDVALPGGLYPRFTILLKHQPLINHSVLGRFDLQLSGHTHGGQVFPGRWLVQIFYPYIAGRYELPGGATLYVSRGAGTFGPPLRVFAPPEVTLILIEPMAAPSLQPLP